SRRRHTRCYRDWSSDVCSSDLSGHEEREQAEDPGADDAEAAQVSPQRGHRREALLLTLTAFLPLLHGARDGPLVRAGCRGSLGRSEERRVGKGGVGGGGAEP